MVAELGSAILRIQGDEAGANDLRLLVQEIANNEEFRKRCRTMGNLVLDVPAESRREASRHCLTILYSWISPDKGPGGFETLGSSVLVSYPLRGSDWWDHIYKDSEGHWHVSDYLLGCLRAIECFWGIKGDLCGDKQDG